MFCLNTGTGKSLNLAFWQVVKLGLKSMWLVSTCNLWWLPVTLKYPIILGFLTLTFKIFHASAKCHKESILVASWQNQGNGMCAQRRLKSAWASSQSDQSSLSAWRKLGSLATHWAHSQKLWSDWADAKADLCLCRAHMSFCWFCH